MFVNLGHLLWHHNSIIPGLDTVLIELHILCSEDGGEVTFVVVGNGNTEQGRKRVCVCERERKRVCMSEGGRERKREREKGAVEDEKSGHGSLSV